MFISFEGITPLSLYIKCCTIYLLIFHWWCWIWCWNSEHLSLHLCLIYYWESFHEIWCHYPSISSYQHSTAAPTELEFWFIIQSSSTLGMYFGAPETHQNEATPTPSAAMSWPRSSGSDGGIDWARTDPSAQSLSFLWFLPSLEIRKKYVINSFLRGTENFNDFCLQ